jgi:hypothetical protein
MTHAHARSRQAVRSLAPRVSEAQAIEAFEKGIWRAIRGERLRSMAAAYLPFRLYEVAVTNGGKRTDSIFAIDAVTGSLDLYEFEHEPARAEVVTLESANALPPRIDEALSLQLLEDKVRRAVFQAGFFRVRGLEVRPRRLSADVHIPYWLGFYGEGDRARLRVMDAVRRQIEGAKARALFEDWILGRLAYGPAGDVGTLAALTAAQSPGDG